MRTETWFAGSAEIIGFLSAAALTWQAYRLVRDLGLVRDLRAKALQQRKDGSTQAAEQSEKTAASIEASITRWDPKDYRLVMLGGIGLPVSFFLKLLALWLAP
ncbi:MAG: hypothetical protein ACHQD6_04245 [Steroidobacterales bacterium]|jgi:hypothetical protein